MESDETRIYNAAHLMVASLAGSLAHVTCKVLSQNKHFIISFSLFLSFLFVVLFWGHFLYSIDGFNLSLWCSRNPYVALYQVN